MLKTPTVICIDTCKSPRSRLTGSYSQMITRFFLFKTHFKALSTICSQHNTPKLGIRTGRILALTATRAQSHDSPPSQEPRRRLHATHTVSGSQPNGKTNKPRASAALFSICNKPPERQATASCLARREWNRLYTWENTAHSVAFLMGSRARCSSRRWGPTCGGTVGPVGVWGTRGKGGVKLMK